MTISSATTPLTSVVKPPQTSSNKTGALNRQSPKASTPPTNPNSRSATITEDLLYGAKAYSKIADKGASVAKKFLSLLSSMYRASSKFKTPVYDAVEKVMRTLQRNHDITSDERRKIKLASLGTADIDAHHESLSGTVELSAVNNASHKHPWSESKLNIFRNFRSKLSMNTTPSSQASKSNGKRTFLSSSRRSSTIPTENLTGMSGFLWKPVSDSDGKLAILLPSSLSGLIKSVILIDPITGKLLETGRFTGVGNGDRSHFRFSQPGGAYPAGILVKITLEDGSSKSLKIDSTAKRVESKG